MKKFILSIGSVAAIVAPVTSVISCGDDDTSKVVAFIKSKAGEYTTLRPKDPTTASHGVASIKTMLQNFKVAIKKTEVKAGTTRTLSDVENGHLMKMTVKMIDATHADIIISADAQTPHTVSNVEFNTQDSAEGDLYVSQNGFGLIIQKGVDVALQAILEDVLHDKTYPNKDAVNREIATLLYGTRVSAGINLGDGSAWSTTKDLKAILHGSATLQVNWN